MVARILQMRATYCDGTIEPSSVRLTRLAMLIECEGSITIGMMPPTKTRNRPALYATVDITNTAQQIIDEGDDTLASERRYVLREARRHAGVALGGNCSKTSIFTVLTV